MKIFQPYVLLLGLLLSLDISAQTISSISARNQLPFPRIQTSNQQPLSRIPYFNKLEKSLTKIELTEPNDVKGSPFLFDEFKSAELVFMDMETGKIFDSLNLQLNYNVYADFMKIKDDNQDEMQLLPRGWNYDILMDEKRFRFISFINNGKEITGYVEIVDSFENGSFLALSRSNEIHQPFGSWSKKFKSENTFYYIGLDGSSIELKNKATQITKTIPQKNAIKIKNYIENNNIEFDEDLRGLKGVARYYSTVE